MCELTLNYTYVSELIVKYLQNLSSSLSKSSRRLWNSPRLSRLELILCTQKRLFLVYKRLLHQILHINENTCTWFDILAVQKCQLHCFQFGSARLATWIVTRSGRSGSVRLGSARLGSARFGSACSVNEPLVFWHLSWGAEASYGKITHDSRRPYQDQTRARFEYLYQPKKATATRACRILHYRPELWNFKGFCIIFTVYSSETSTYRLTSNVLCTICIFPKLTPIRHWYMTFKIRYGCDVIRKLCRQHAEVRRNYVDRNVCHSG